MFYLEEIKSKLAFDNTLNKQNRFTCGQFLQSFAWSKFNKKLDQKTIKIIVRKKANGKEKNVAKALVITKKVKKILRFGYCPYGPVWDKNLTQKEIQTVFKLIEKHLKKSKLHFFRFNPPVEKDKSLNIDKLKLSKSKTKQPQKTLFLKLNQSYDNLLAQMKSKTRYNIRLAQRKKLQVKKGISQKSINDFLTLSRITSERDNFKSWSSNYYKTLIKTLQEYKMIQIYTAYYKKKAIASNIVVFFNDTATYLHGASSNEQRNLMPTYALQWAAIQDAKKNKCKYYDFWGINSQKWPGVTRFKVGFGGQKIEFHPAYEIPLNKKIYFLYSLTRLFF
ncbi:MAG: peptidoglycan bridge formation glycyltransferase FemA/FemB family protein [Candidatus Moranbacteria bacterium]|nr:peptidoglycan bridge formation glycyltransferase FemA/FemB family protein [Candidatus Moranbacteria bacterium]